MRNLAEKIVTLKGPILVLGASGFVGANLLHTLLKSRNDVFGTSSTLPNWRLQNIDEKHLVEGDLLVEGALDEMLDRIKPQTIFNCIAYGAYSFQNDLELIYKTNVMFAMRLLEACHQRKVDCVIHAGSSSEYGDDAAAPDEETALKANSHYSVTKSAIANLIYFYGKKKSMKVANLRLYSVYGPYEDSSRLIPKVILRGLEKKFTEFTDPDISRDFIFSDDACEAFIDAAKNLAPNNYGESFNIGSGVRTTIGNIAELSKEIYEINSEPQFNYPARKWDVKNWFAKLYS
jgi:dolichol-phosphate mannosyltransferase